jgi:hypothetical protein
MTQSKNNNMGRYGDLIYGTVLEIVQKAEKF